MRKNIQKGFTLAEITIALFLLAAGVSALMRAFSVGLAAYTENNQQALALHIAQAKMEEMANTPLASLVDIASTTDPNFSDFSVTVDVDEGADPRQVDVTVVWQAAGGQASISLSTLITTY